jgi:ribosomal-protein-alanine N-acetyltransferase
MSIALQIGQRVVLRRPRPSDRASYLAAVRRSRRLHRPWVEPPWTAAGFDRWLVIGRRPRTELHVVARLEDGELVGVFNISEIVRGPLQSGYLGYYAFAPHAGKGYMREGLELLLRQAFLRYKLHRVEANIQPRNEASIRFVRAAGFRNEGYSPRYLKIAGRWCGHERWALLSDEWLAACRRETKRAR